MAGTLYAGFDLARVGSMGADFVGTVGDPLSSGPATITVDTYCHIDISSVPKTADYGDFATAVKTAFDAAVLPNGDEFTVTLSTTTRLYTIEYSGDFQMDFTSAEGARLAAALGFTADHASATSGTGYQCVLDGELSYTSNVTPYYLVPLARSNPSRYTRPSEATGFTKKAMSVNGNGYSVSPLTLARYESLTLPAMELANVFADDATDAQPWTIEHCIQHARGHQPLLFDFDAVQLVAQLAEEDQTFHEMMRQPAFSSGSYHGVWNVSFTKLQRLGVL